MKKAVLACLLATGAVSAFAEWMNVLKTDDINFFIDLQTIRNDGDLRKVWELQDFKQPKKGGEMSARVRSEYDCKNELWRYGSYSRHSQSMAGGETLGTFDPTHPWGAIPPNSASEIVLKIVCAK